MQNIEKMLIPIKSQIDGKRGYMEQKERVIRANSLYLEQFERQIGKVVIDPIFSIEAMQTKIKAAFLQKRDSFLANVTLLEEEVKDLRDWLEKKSGEMEVLCRETEEVDGVVSLIKEIVALEKMILENLGTIAHQKSFLEGITFVTENIDQKGE